MVCWWPRLSFSANCTLGRSFVHTHTSPLIAEPSPIPQLFGCVPGKASGSSYLASIYVLLSCMMEASCLFFREESLLNFRNTGLLLAMIIQMISARKVMFSLLRRS